MKNKRNIFLFLIWTISCANSVPTGFGFIPNKFSTKPRYSTTWTLNVPNPTGSFSQFLPDFSQIFRNPMSFMNSNNYYHPPGYPSHHHYPNYEYHPQFPHQHETHQKPQVTNFTPESHVTQEEKNKVQPARPEFESSTMKEVINLKPNMQIESQETQSNNNAILIESLNKALNKLNNLLPPKSNTEKENINTSTENVSSLDPTMIKPEVLVDSLNKAIDMLSEVLSMKTTTTQNIAAATPPFFTKNPSMPVMNQEQMTLSLEGAIKELEKLFMRLPDELKNPTGDQKPIIGIGQFHPIFVPRPIVNNGIPISKPIQEVSTTEPPETLFTSFPKNTTTESSTLFTSSNNLFTSSKRDKNKNKGMDNSTPMSSESVESSESSESVESTESSEEENVLFTSSPKQKDKTTPSPDDESENMLFTSSHMLFTSIPKKPSIKTVTNPGTENMKEISSTTPSQSTTETIETNERFKDDEELTTTGVTFDVRFGNEPRAEDSFVFPDEFEKIKKPDRIAASSIHENENLASRFGQSNPSTIKPSIINLINSHVEDEFELPNQNPFLIISDKNMQQNNQINLEYQPQRPSFQPEPLVYPMPIIPHGDPLPGSSTERNNYQQLGDRNNVPSTTTQRIVTSNPHTNTPISLEYKPSRPPFAPNPVVYPMPAIPPGEPLPGSSTERNNQQQLGDRNNVPTTTTQNIITSEPNQNTPISLEYKPSRPPFAPDPVVYPRPIIPPGEPLPGSSTEKNSHQQLGDRNNVPSTTTHRIVNENTPISLEYKPSRPPFAPNPVVYPMPANFGELGDRNQITTTTSTPRPTTRTTRRPYQNTPIVLGYKPSRPPYVPEPWVYPSPGLIPPGTPWPASSTERPLGK